TCGGFRSRPCRARSAALRKRCRAFRTRRAGRYEPGRARSRYGCARRESCDPVVRNFSVRVARIRFFPRASPMYRWRVSAYEDLDAFKACHQLTLAVHRLAERLEERDATLSGHLWAAALCASSRIARGSAFRNRRMFAACVDRTLSAL